MRISSEIFLRADEIASDYRRHFIHFLKECFKNTEFENIVLEGDGLPKPYTFSVGFFRILSISSETIRFENPLFFDFSTALDTMISHIYNCLRKLPGSKLLGKTVENVRMNLPVPVKISEDVVKFKSIGHMVLTKRGNEVPKTKEEIEDALNHSLAFKIKAFREFGIGVNLPEMCKIRVLDHDLKESLVRHYGGFVKAFRGILELSSSPEVLQFLHEAGVGFRTGQGFGMVKVVK